MTVHPFCGELLMGSDSIKDNFTEINIFKAFLFIYVLCEKTRNYKYICPLKIIYLIFYYYIKLYT